MCALKIFHFLMYDCTNSLSRMCRYMDLGREAHPLPETIKHIVPLLERI